jgi:hypothetical protein
MKKFIIVSIFAVFWVGMTNCSSRQDSGKTESVKESEAVFFIKRYLENAKTIYENRFKNSIPYCGRCSDLELLIMLENALFANVTLPDTIVSHIMKAEHSMITEKLKDIEKKYEEKFNRQSPWWWLCSDEIRIERLENAINKNMPYPNYSTDVRNKSYRVGKLMAEYDMRFKTLPLEWHCSLVETMWRLQKELEKPSPYLMKEERKTYETKIKADYSKKFGADAEELEASLTYVEINEKYYTLEINRTETGTFVLDSRKYIGRELGYENWLDFVKGFGDCYYNRIDSTYVLYLLTLLGGGSHRNNNQFCHGTTSVTFRFSDGDEFRVYSRDTNWYRWESYLSRWR